MYVCINMFYDERLPSLMLLMINLFLHSIILSYYISSD